MSGGITNYDVASGITAPRGMFSADATVTTAGPQFAGMLTAGNVVEAEYVDGGYYKAKILQNLSNRASGWPTPNDRFVVEYTEYNERATVTGEKIRAGLLQGWTQHHDTDSGHEYYMNDASGESRWDRPVRSYERR